MSNTYFDFKQFRINQDRCAMKVGTDGVLLGAWFGLEKGNSVLDIGTGTGLVSLMAAQRGAGHVTGIEIDASAAAQAGDNVSNSPYSGIIDIIESDINSFTPSHKFDRIVCNPPFFRNSLRCPDGSRNTARHNDSLSYEQLVAAAVRMIAPEGELTVILPAETCDEFTRIATLAGLYAIRVCNVVTVTGKMPKRTMLTFSPLSAPIRVSTLAMCNADGSKTPEFTDMISPFYIRY